MLQNCKLSVQFIFVTKGSMYCTSTQGRTKCVDFKAFKADSYCMVWETHTDTQTS